MPSVRRSLAALAAPPPAPPSAAPAAPAGRAGRARTRRPGCGAASDAALERLTTAIKAAPTVGYIWGRRRRCDWLLDQVRLALRIAEHAGATIVLATDRRLGAHARRRGRAASQRHRLTSSRSSRCASTPKAWAKARASLTTPVVVDTAANTLALDELRGRTGVARR